MDGEIFLISSDSSVPSSPTVHEPSYKVSALCEAYSSKCSQVTCILGNKNEELVLSNADSSSTNLVPGDQGEFQDGSESIYPNPNEIEIIALEQEFEENESVFGSPVKSQNNYHSISESDDSEEKEEEILGENIPSLGLDPDTEGKQDSKSKKRPKRTKEEFARAKEIKAKARAEKAALLEQIRRTKPGECSKYLTVQIDSSLLKSKIFPSKLDSIPEGGLNIEIIHQEENSVTWIRTLPDGEQQHEHYILIVWSSETLISAIQCCTLLDTFKSLKKRYPAYHTVLAVFGLKKHYGNNAYFKKKAFRSNYLGNTEEKTSQKRKLEYTIALEDIELELTQLEVLLNISHRKIETEDDLVALLRSISKTIAEIPHRLEVEKKDSEKAWFARGDSRDCVRLDKDLNGLSQLWLQQLSQFTHSSLDVAKSVADLYPTPSCLRKAYKLCTSQKEREQLLQNIPIKRCAGSSTSFRKIGPELSKKICFMYSQLDGDVLLSQE